MIHVYDQHEYTTVLYDLTSHLVVSGFNDIQASDNDVLQPCLCL